LFAESGDFLWGLIIKLSLNLPAVQQILSQRLTHALITHPVVWFQAILTIVVHILDENDNRPAFRQPVYYGTVSEGAPDGSVILGESVSCSVGRSFGQLVG